MTKVVAVTSARRRVCLASAAMLAVALAFGVWRAQARAPRPLSSLTTTRVVSVALTGDTLLTRWLAPPRLAAVSELVDFPDFWNGEKVSPAIPRLTGAAETIVALRPDLAVVSPFANPLLAEQLEAVGIATYDLHLPERVRDVISEVRELGQRLGLSSESEAWCNELSVRVAIVRKRGLARRRWRAVVLESSYAYGKGTLIDDALSLLGTTNVLAVRGIVGLSPLSAEQLLAWKPDVAFVAVSGSALQADARQELATLGGYAALADLLIHAPRWVFGIPRAQLSAMSPSIVDALESMDGALQQWTS